MNIYRTLNYAECLTMHKSFNYVVCLNMFTSILHVLREKLICNLYYTGEDRKSETIVYYSYLSNGRDATKYS